MSIITHQIQPKGRTANIKLTLDNSVDLLGYQQEIEHLTTNVGADLINPETDLEIRRFGYDIMSGEVQVFSFFFYNQQTNQYETTYNALGYTSAEIKKNNAKLQNSYYTLEFYDTYDSFAQTKIFTTYLTKVIENEINPFPVYYSGMDNQLFYWNIPISYINKFTGSTAYGYVRLRYYDAKTGVLRQFYNKYYENSSSPIKMHFKVKLDLAARTWKFVLAAGYNSINAYESHGSLQYNARVNNTFSNTCTLSQSYPKNSCNVTANTFNPATGTYC